MNKESNIIYYVLSGLTLIFLIAILSFKQIDLFFYFWILAIYWPAKTTEIILKKNNWYTKARYAYIGVISIILFWIIIALLMSLLGVHADL